MDLATAHLAPVLARTVALLGDSREQLASFESWAASQVFRLSAAARQGPAVLALEAELLRSELEALAPAAREALTARTERMRVCQRQWLTGLVDFVDELLDGGEPARVVHAA